MGNWNLKRNTKYDKNDLPNTLYNQKENVENVECPQLEVVI